MYYATLLALDDFDTAEKVVKERLKRRHKNSRSTALVDLGSLYLHFDKREQALEAFMEALENLQPGRPSAVSLANAFIKLDELDMALATYERAEKLGTTGFDYELANLQGMRGDFEGMVDAYMALLEHQAQLPANRPKQPQPQLAAHDHRRQPRIGSGGRCSAPFKHTPTTRCFPSCWCGTSTRFGILPLP